MTDPLVLNVANVAAVVGIHYIWRSYYTWIKRRERALRERVAYMLWMAAHQVN